MDWGRVRDEVIWPHLGTIALLPGLFFEGSVVKLYLGVALWGALMAQLQVRDLWGMVLRYRKLTDEMLEDMKKLGGSNGP